MICSSRWRPLGCCLVFFLAKSLMRFGSRNNVLKLSRHSPADDDVFVHDEGEELALSVDDVAFGLPRIKLLVSGLEPMPKLLKEPLDVTSTRVCHVARVHSDR